MKGLIVQVLVSGVTIGALLWTAIEAFHDQKHFTHVECVIGPDGASVSTLVNVVAYNECEEEYHPFPNPKPYSTDDDVKFTTALAPCSCHANTTNYAWSESNNGSTVAIEGGGIYVTPASVSYTWRGVEYTSKLCGRNSKTICCAISPQNESTADCFNAPVTGQLDCGMILSVNGIEDLPPLQQGMELPRGCWVYEEGPTKVFSSDRTDNTGLIVILVIVIVFGFCALVMFCAGIRDLLVANKRPTSGLSANQPLHYLMLQ